MALGTGALARLGGMLASAAVVSAASIYSIADWRRVPLDQPARDALVAEGKAQTFVQTSRGFIHVRTAGPETGPVVVLVHGGSSAVKRSQTGSSRWSRRGTESSYPISSDTGTPLGPTCRTPGSSTSADPSEASWSPSSPPRTLGKWRQSP